MTAAAAEALISAQETIGTTGEFRNTQSLLLPDGGRPNYPVRAAAVLAYALLLTAAVNFSLPHTETPAEEPLELVVVPNPAVDQPPPEEIPQPEELDDTPPPPEAIEPVAPIEPPKPPAPKPVPKVVEKNPPTPRPATARTDVAPTQSAAASANAQQSIATNQFLSCMQRSARNAAPDSPIPKHGRVVYRATFSASGAMTGFSILSSSGIPSFDAVATRVGSRCGTLPAIGRVFTITGGVLF